MMFEPEIETRPWTEQFALDDAAYRKQLDYLFANSRFYRDKLRAAGFDTAAKAGGLADIAKLPLTEKDELRATRSDADPIGTHLAVPMDKVVRVFSTSGTTGVPSYIPLTAGDLENWIRTSSRSYMTSGIAPGQRIITTYGAGPFVAGASLDAFNRIGMCHIPVGSGKYRTADGGRAPAQGPGDCLHALLRAASRRMGARSRNRRQEFQRRAPAGRRRARRRRARDARAARSGLGREGDRGHGHRRHLALAVGRMRAPERHASRRARLRSFRGHRHRNRRTVAARRRGAGRARSDASAPGSRAASALSHARPCRHPHGAVPVRAHGAARALHRPHRRHADRARASTCFRRPCAKWSIASRRT